MCKIRVIFKAEDNRILNDIVYQLDELEISPVDRPSYITCVPHDDKIYLNSYFINEEEKFKDVVVDSGLKFSYGLISGRIREMITSYLIFHDTTMFRCTKALPESLNVRASNNAKEYLKLYSKVLILRAATEMHGAAQSLMYHCDKNGIIKIETPNKQVKEMAKLMDANISAYMKLSDLEKKALGKM